ncbi:transcription initiation factor TFIID subunit 11-like [Panicum virgatum]|uniref:transcription initiation factor TFIID subunit 11-like n=1 Tax=Panicum virgatum TaxID=38727 RepID=UPI0019D4F392|nr:transcription initiation factor TFIID subunit 11-like [Panicum virgatum]
MAISSSSGSNSIGSLFSPSSSSSSASSLDPISESRESTPEYDPTAVHEALAPLHWDAEEFDFEVVSENDEPKTDDEDLWLLFQEEPGENSDDCFSWDRADSSLEEEIDSSSVEEDPMAERAFRFPGSSEEESKEDSDDSGGGWSGDDEASNGSSADESSGSDDDGNDSSGGDVPARSPKRRRH